MVQPFWKTAWQFLTKLNVLLPYNPAIMLFGIYPKELETYDHKKNLQVYVYSSFIHNCHYLKAIKMSFSR